MNLRNFQKNVIKFFNFLKPDVSFKKVIKNAGIVLSGNIGGGIFGLLSLSIFTKSQGPELFGYYVIFLVFLEFVDKFFYFQTWPAFIKFASDFQARNENHNVIMLIKFSLLIEFGSSIIAAIVAFSLSSFALDFFNIPEEYHAILLFVLLTFLFKATEVSIGIFRFFDRFALQAKIQVYSSAIKFVMFGFVILFYPSFELFVYAIIFSQFITAMIKYFFALSILKENKITISQIFREKINIPLLKELKVISFIIYNNFDVITRMMTKQFDTLLIGKLYSAELVGIYQIVKEIANILAKLVDPIYQSIYPNLARLLASKKKLETKQMAIKISSYLTFAVLIFYVLFGLFGQLAVDIVFGKEFLYAYNVSLVYIIAVFIAIISLPLYPLQIAFGYAKQAFKNQVESTLAYIPILLILTFYFELVGASIAYIFYYLYITRLRVALVKKEFQFKSK